MNTCRIQVGRLMEIRVDAGYGTVADVDHMMGLIGDLIARIPVQTRVIIAADWRGCRVMSSEASERALAMLTRNNPRVERSAILTSDASSVAVLQFLRLVRESGHPQRRLFSRVVEMQSWLAEVLSPAEGVRLYEFLDHEPPSVRRGSQPPR
jgi:hypothetical protein